ncbi:hypothetical protein QD47_01035 [Paenibacillus terrae]|uniref:Transposase n=1 Tax=Paenibacillus terrae TaxID=159743 RepID=A0A0D7X971_9BACL|nr:hypothetical protein QD47_01035 [Paenibacillus terrae]
MNEPVLKKAMNTLEFLSQDREARLQYEARQRYLHDEASMIEGAKEEGKAEGKAESQAEIARNMLRLGLDIDIIAKASGLSEAEIRALQS